MHSECCSVAVVVLLLGVLVLLVAALVARILPSVEEAGVANAASLIRTHHLSVSVTVPHLVGWLLRFEFFFMHLFEILNELDAVLIFVGA